MFFWHTIGNKFLTLLSNIVGLAGIFSVFGTLLGISDKVIAALNADARKKNGGTTVAKEEEGGTPRDDGATFSHSNPLREREDLGVAATEKNTSPDAVLPKSMRQITDRQATAEGAFVKIAAVTAEARATPQIQQFVPATSGKLLQSQRRQDIGPTAVPYRSLWTA